MKRWAWGVLACFFLSGILPMVSPGAIDLVALKKKEEERRKKISKSKQVVNDSNVAVIAGSGKSYGFVQMESETPPAEETVAETAGAPTTTAAAAEISETKQPDFWKKQQTELQERIAELKESIGSQQSELNKLWADFYIKNIPAEQDAIKVQIGNLTNQLEQKKLFLSEAETQLDALYEKARKAGVPPGWLR